jgi:hypothetical protein
MEHQSKRTSADPTSPGDPPESDLLDRSDDQSARRLRTCNAPVHPGLSQQHVDGSAQRLCLRCRTVFASEGFGERICRRCKGREAWKTPAALPRGVSRH